MVEASEHDAVRLVLSGEKRNGLTTAESRGPARSLFSPTPEELQGQFDLETLASSAGSSSGIHNRSIRNSSSQITCGPDVMAAGVEQDGLDDTRVGAHAMLMPMSAPLHVFPACDVRGQKREGSFWRC